MKPVYRFLLMAGLCTISISWTIPIEWITENHKNYTLHYTSADLQNKDDYNVILAKGIQSVESFIKSPFKNTFGVYIHPNRQSLDAEWQKDWGVPDFKSECWMVASGIATKLVMLSPKRWSAESCEHDYNETAKTQNLITHELFHVYHGQLNASPDFSNIDKIDWFVEGFATYASGQCDADRIKEIKRAIEENKIPASLDNFWTGKLKYGLSGSVVLYIDYKYGRDTLKELLPMSKKAEILSKLAISEQDLIKNWKQYINTL
ncbi:hypothetical protein [Emticicia sp. BO119]|uniref:hypothetical protein n=1 Tax=Emticicia sp. BO119 TaxID=2757768 RepID=UPI0015F096A0|nr:hypothetical protein [Emticicia sp. BO119]MBA4853073.1 hypothetical protein [Emticicia sp. BO119]